MRPWLRSVTAGAALFALCAPVAARLLRKPAVAEPSSSVQAGWVSPEEFTTAARVDAAFAAEWEKAGVAPVEPAPKLALLRRLNLALTGAIPSLQEIRAMEAYSGPNPVQWWLSHLFEDRRYADYLGERFARTVVGVEDGPFIIYRRHRLVSWLSDQFHANRPYDAMVRSMITSSGIWTSRPEVNFITVTVDPNMEPKTPDPVKLAARVSRAFLGVRIDCVQCHDDKFGGPWKQSDFHQLASFFGGAEMSLTGVRDNPAHAYEFRYLGKKEKEIVPPRTPFAAGLLPAEGRLRERLAAWVTHPDNRPFARAMVNRIWALMFNRPLHRPVDSIPLDGPLPAGLEILADDFTAHGFDIRRLIRQIAATRVFQLDSRAGAPADAPAEAGRALFASYPLTRLRPEQVAGGILQSAKLRTINADSHVLDRVIRFFQQNDFIRRYGDAGADEFDEAGGTIPQRLALMNGKLVQERTKEDWVMNASTRIGWVAPDDATAIETAYLAALTRRPTRPEAEHFAGLFKRSREIPRSQLMADLFWTLINSTEFSWNH